MSIDLLIVDDQDLIRVGIAMVLGAAEGIEVVGEAADGATAVRRVAELRPDVVLMDVRMPGMDGISATRRIVAEHPATRVLVLTTFDLDDYGFGALNAGASGFLLKSVPAAELIAAVRTVAAGDAMVSPRLTRRLIEVTRGSLPDTEPQPALTPDLTARELEVLVAIARGLTNAEIARDLFVSESTVKTHVGRVLSKLRLRDRVHAVIYAYERRLVG